MHVSPLIMKGCHDMLYRWEGMAQGDSLFTDAFAVATVPLIRELENMSKYGMQTMLKFCNINNMCGWLEQLMEMGPY